MAKKYTADTFEGGAANLTGLAVNTDDLVVSTLGNVGIGGTPTHKLYVRYDVAAASDLDPTAIKLFNNSDGGSAIEFSNGVAAKSKLSFGVEGTGGSQNETYIGFSTSVNGATPTERMRVGSSGNVSMGESSARNARLLLNNAGSQGAPQLMLIDSGDSGKQSEIRFDSGNLIFDYWGGSSRSERMRIDSSGNVGIGTSPVSNLHIKDSTSSTDVRIQDSTGNTTLYLQSQNGLGVFGTITNNDLRFDTNDTERMRIGSSGNVGIGTSDPNNGLHVKTSTNGEGLTLQINSTTEGDYSQLSFAPSTADNATAPVYIRGVRGSNLATSYLTLNTNSSERMRIDSSGNVGIGETSPDRQLHLKSSVPAIRLEDSDVSGLYHEFLATSAGEFQFKADGGNVQSSSKFTFTIDGSEKMRIDSSGNVGIGTGASVDERLHVQGSVDNDDIALKIENTFDDNSSATPPSAAVLFSTASNNGHVRVFGAPADTAANHRMDIGATASTSYLTFSPNGSEKMRIDSSGNVGINCTPNKLLEISDTLATTLRITSTKNGTWTTSQELGRLEWFGNDTSGEGAAVKGFIALKASDTFGAGFHMTFGTTDGSNGISERMRIRRDGDVCIGTTEAFGGTLLSLERAFGGNTAITINTTTSGTTYVPMKFLHNGTLAGYISTSTTSTSYNETSDYRLKENVIDLTGALDRIEQLQPKRFNFISDPETTVDGFIAHEVQSVIPEAITGEKDAVDEDGNPEYQGIDKSKIVPLLVGAIKELKAEIETLKSQINS